MAPDYIVCLECETPCYTFEWEEGDVSEAVCTMCGNDDVDLFLTQEGVDALASGH